MSKDKGSLQSRLLADFALLVITAIWGSTFFMVDKAIETVNVFIFIALRFSAGFVVLGVIFGYSVMKSGIQKKDLLRGVLIGVFLFLGYVFQTFGLDLGTEPGKAAFITGLSVVFIPILAAILLRKKPHILSWLGIAIAVLGMALLTITDITTFQTGKFISDGLVVLCAFAFAFHIISIDKFVEKTYFATLAIVQIGTTALLAWLAIAIFIPFQQVFTVVLFPIVFNPQVIFAFLFTGILGTAGVIAVQTFAQKRTSPVHVAVIFAMEPVFAAIFSLLFTAEVLTIRQWFGCALIVVSMIGQQLIAYHFVEGKRRTKEQEETELEIAKQEKQDEHEGIESSNK